MLRLQILLGNADPKLLHNSTKPLLSIKTGRELQIHGLTVHRERCGFILQRLVTESPVQQICQIWILRVQLQVGN